MATSPDPSFYGTIKTRPFETVGRSDSWAEQRVLTVNVVGKYDQLEDAVKPGDSMGQHASWFGAKVESDVFVRTVNLTSQDGVTGELNLTLLKCAKGKHKPYNVTWEVGMEEVQRRLICHPKVQEKCDIHVLFMWEQTEKRYRVDKDKDSGELKFYYTTGELMEGDTEPVREPVKGDWNIAYCKAVTAGIETYNQYMPVISKNSFYLELPGVDYDNAHVVTGGTINEFSTSTQIGNFNTPDLLVKGYDDNSGRWFKSADKFASNADGTWQRTEQWTFTPDKDHGWIYDGKLGG